MKYKWNNLTELINKSKNILLSTHVNPDADGLGSEVAMYYYLQSLKKHCKIINISGITEKYEFLNKNKIIEKYDQSRHDEWIKQCDCAIIFDIGDFRRLGVISDIIKMNKIYCVSIDHHPSDDAFFNYKFLDVTSPATGFMVWKYFKYIKLKAISINIAEALYAALITDTGSFRYNSTTPQTHVMAKELLETGLKPYDIYAKIYEQRSLSQMKLLGEAINSLRIVDEFASLIITQKMINRVNATLEDIDGFTDFMRSIKGVEVAFMISEINSHKYRINFRSRGKYIINDIAQYFNGGGHELAAGAMVDDIDLKSLEDKILNMLKNKKDNLCL